MCPDGSIEELDKLLPDVSYKTMSGLSLAFIGDAVYELMIRKYIISKGEAKISELHRKCVKLVNADFQADMSDILADELSEDEKVIFKRGRNAHSAHTPKNKSEAQYHKSTGFEALIGYLYLKKDFKRLEYIFSLIINQGEEK